MLFSTFTFPSLFPLLPFPSPSHHPLPLPSFSPPLLLIPSLPLSVPRSPFLSSLYSISVPLSLPVLLHLSFLLKFPITEHPFEPKLNRRETVLPLPSPHVLLIIQISFKWPLAWKVLRRIIKLVFWHLYLQMMGSGCVRPAFVTLAKLLVSCLLNTC